MIYYGKDYVDRMKKEWKKSQSICSQCPNDYVSFVCRDCSILVCDDLNCQTKHRNTCK